MRQIEISGWHATLPAARLDLFFARKRFKPPVPFKSYGNQGGWGRLFLCEELSA
jgi:hypothetical protein